MRRRGRCLYPVEVTEETWLEDAAGDAAPVGVADPVSVGLSVRDAVRLDVADCDIVLSCESDCDGEGVSVCVIDAETEGVALGLAVPVELGVTVCEALCVKDGVLQRRRSARRSCPMETVTWSACACRSSMRSGCLRVTYCASCWAYTLGYGYSLGWATGTDSE